MNILSIETSCDETAVSIVRTTGNFPNAEYAILGNALFSQIDIHREYGGVFPALAKREHAKTLVPMLTKALGEAGLLQRQEAFITQTQESELSTILHKETGLEEALRRFLESWSRPGLDLIAVTAGPGLEPALWVGINFARALSYYWNIPVVPINHMEGHILSSIFSQSRIAEILFPALTLLVSGGHTELVLVKKWGDYECVGKTRDDAIGEAFDKVARMLGLPYPGGPEISARAQSARDRNLPTFIKLPRPMLDSDDLDFSFSGLKTAVRYAIRDKTLTPEDIDSVACEFENSVTEVLLDKTKRAIDQFEIQTLIVGGGVSANTHIRESFDSFLKKEYPSLAVYFPSRHLSTDNSIMIALAGHMHAQKALPYHSLASMKADGNLSLNLGN
jgi:N6-L-threonylcarbamoyladenine synthase